jgi:hypothetical protein
MRRRRGCFRGAEGAGEDGFARVKVRAGGRARVRRRICRLGGRNARPIVVSDRVRAGLGAGGFPLLLAKPGGGIDLRVNGRRGGFVLGGAGATVRIPIGIRPSMATIMERALIWADMLFRVMSGSRSAISQRRARTRSRPRFSRRCSSVCLLHEVFVHGGPVLEHVGADPGFGFGVGGGVGVETDGFGGTAVGHGSRENHVGKGYFLIGDEVAHWIFGHKWLRLPRSCEVAREKLRAEISELLEARREPIFRFLIML